MMVSRNLLQVMLIGCVLIGLRLNAVLGQAAAPCGVVDAIDYPIEPLVAGYDDFGLFRRRFGGNHTAIDVAFDRWGDPVRAAARGRVTYADPEGWDTEKGVVIVAHTFPDGDIYYSLYGHMEETDSAIFPAVGTCVERGEIIGAVGWPSRGRPHLHYEIRDFLPNDGGPGYVSGNPLEEGWYNPLDFTAVWRARFNPAFLGTVTAQTPASLPPIQLESGAYGVASGDVITVLSPPDRVLWRIQTSGNIISLASLPGDRIAAYTESGQAVVVQDGRFAAVWQVDTGGLPFRVLGETLVFPQPDGELIAYDSSGTPLWRRIGSPGAEHVFFQMNAAQTQVGWAVQDAQGVSWRVVNPDGQLAADLRLTAAPLAVAAPDGSWMLLDGNELKRQQTDRIDTLMTVAPAPGTGSLLAADSGGGTYVFLDDAERTLMALDASGQTRWRVNYPREVGEVPPLLAAGSGCLLYALDGDGMLNVFDGADGSLVNQIALYAGGRRVRNPAARLLLVDSAEQVYAATGYLTLMLLDGRKLGGPTCSE
ncbi:MAG: peptidoglycan DD-metalloendopeptidase family protein [Anaerolineae bacterium]|nr:peptidoglycan DD-metalloendopeptidase family protein [Anaerolineae bacterium]